MLLLSVTILIMIPPGITQPFTLVVFLNYFVGLFHIVILLLGSMFDNVL
jgi:hypothetical protein